MNDRRITLAVVAIIGANSFLLIAGIVWGVTMGKALDNGIIALASGTLGYLGGMLNKQQAPDKEPPAAKPKP